MQPSEPLEPGETFFDEGLGIDAVLATVDGVYVAETRPERRLALF